MTTRANRKTRLQAIMIGRCQGHDTFAAFQPMGIFRFWRNGKFNIFRCLQPLYFFSLPAPTHLLLPFCAGVLFSSRSHRALIDRKKHEKIEGCDQSNSNIIFEKPRETDPFKFNDERYLQTNWKRFIRKEK